MTIDQEKRRLIILTECIRKNSSLTIERFAAENKIHRATYHRLINNPHQMSRRVQKILEGVTNEDFPNDPNRS